MSSIVNWPLWSFSSWLVAVCLILEAETAVKFLLNKLLRVIMTYVAYIEQAGVYGCQNNTETEIIKLKEKITKTKDQLAQLYPKYDTERRNEEQAASQWVDAVYLLTKLLHICFLLRAFTLFSFILSLTLQVITVVFCTLSLFRGTKLSHESFKWLLIYRTDFTSAVSVLSFWYVSWGRGAQLMNKVG